MHADALVFTERNGHVGVRTVKIFTARSRNGLLRSVNFRYENFHGTYPQQLLALREFSRHVAETARCVPQIITEHNGQVRVSNVKIFTERIRNDYLRCVNFHGT